jgi:hypothetical protein
MSGEGLLFERAACPRRRGHGTRLIVFYYNGLASQRSTSISDVEGNHVRRVSPEEKIRASQPERESSGVLVFGRAVRTTVEPRMHVAFSPLA